LIEAQIKTGRHHQIRAQAASHGHPLAGDIKYGGKLFPGSGKARGGCFFLHAWKIRFLELPGWFPDDFSGYIEAPLPEAFLTRIEALFNMEAIGSVVEETGKSRRH
jgi:23S rRNA pseudouridine955/2504/2580 synthase